MCNFMSREHVLFQIGHVVKSREGKHTCSPEGLYIGMTKEREIGPKSLLVVLFAVCEHKQHEKGQQPQRRSLPS
jgi:hypothetical protein